jgi:hypothetical protein
LGLCVWGLSWVSGLGSGYMRKGGLECVGSARKGIIIRFRARELQEEGRSTAGESVETRLNAHTLEF